MYILLFIYLIVAFIAFVPGVLFTLPIKGSKLMVTFAHAILFALVWSILHKSTVKLASMLNIHIGGDMMEAMEGEEEEDDEENNKNKEGLNGEEDEEDE